MIIQSRDAVVPYLTKDGSEIRELIHPAVHGNLAQSLAEATIFPGCRTALHRHHRSEELYHVTAGAGRLTFGGETLLLHPGDTVCIPPGTPHCIEALGPISLRVLCCCAPPYAHDDTELLEGPPVG
ncbi:MAG: cupin domain-containing protein [Zoogloeaceae bacterium]|nr:cupin domain-containing protein [Zoogloeaceae bacterium]